MVSPFNMSGSGGGGNLSSSLAAHLATLSSSFPHSASFSNSFSHSYSPHSPSPFLKLEANFFKGFTCCGLDLRDLHGLLEHFEECHVRFDAEAGSQNFNHPAIAAAIAAATQNGGSNSSVGRTPPMGASRHRVSNQQHEEDDDFEGMDLDDDDMPSTPLPGGDSAGSPSSPGQDGARNAMEMKRRAIIDFNQASQNSFATGRPQGNVNAPVIGGPVGSNEQTGPVSAFDTSVLLPPLGGVAGQTAAGGQQPPVSPSTALGGKKKAFASAMSAGLASRPSVLQGSPYSTPESSMPGTPIVEEGDSLDMDMSDDLDAFQVGADAAAMAGSSRGVFYNHEGSVDPSELAASGSMVNGLGVDKGNQNNLPSVISPASLVLPVPGSSNNPQPGGGGAGGPSGVSAMSGGNLVPGLTPSNMPMMHSGPPRPKPFKCPIPGCDKSYKQQNGLKYHRLHGHCNNNNQHPDSPRLSQEGREQTGGSGNGGGRRRRKVVKEDGTIEWVEIPKGEEKPEELVQENNNTQDWGGITWEEENKPYLCHLAGCGKRYKK